MPYGGTIFSTVSADLVQTDVDAIVQGLTSGRTIADLYEEFHDYDLAQPFLFSFRNSIDNLDSHINSQLYSIYHGKPWLESISEHLFDMDYNIPFLKEIVNELQGIRSVLEDVHDASQHALRTV